MLNLPSFISNLFMCSGIHKWENVTCTFQIWCSIEHVIRRHLLKSRFLCQLEINFIKNVMNRSLRTILLKTPVILWKFSWEFTLSYHTLTTPILARKKEADIISVIYYFWFYFIQRLKNLYHLIISEHWWLWTFNMGFYT